LGERPADLLFDAWELPLFEFQVAAVAQLHREGRDQSSSVRFQRERLEVVILAILGHDVECHLVKGAGTHVTYPGPKESFAKFVAGLAGEGHCEDLIGTDFVVGNPTLNAQSEDVGLAGTGGRANEQAPRGGHDGLALFGCQPDEQVARKGGLVHGHYDATGTA